MSARCSHGINHAGERHACDGCCKDDDFAGASIMAGRKGDEQIAALRAELAAVTKERDRERQCHIEASAMYDEAIRERDAALLDLSQARAEFDSWRILADRANRGRDRAIAAARIWKACTKKWRRIVKQVDVECQQAHECEIAAVKRAEEAEASAADRHDKLVAVADKLRDERERANVEEAKAAALRDAMTKVRRCIITGADEGPVYCEKRECIEAEARPLIDAALDVNAGRALLERHAAEMKAKDEEIARLRKTEADAKLFHDFVRYNPSSLASQLAATKAELASAHEEIKGWRRLHDEHLAGQGMVRADVYKLVCDQRDVNYAKLGRAVATLQAVRNHGIPSNTLSELQTRIDAILADVESSVAGEAWRTVVAAAVWFQRYGHVGLGGVMAELVNAIAAVDARRGGQ